MFYARIVSLLFVLLTCTSALANGIVMGATRVIYDGSKKEASLTVQNRNTKEAYLIQAWIDDANGNRKSPFVITPPLFRLESNKENILRLVRTGGTLAENKETVYWVNVKAIPPAAEGNENTLQIAVRTRMKLFYRPAGLPGLPADAPAKLSFKTNGSQLQITNNSAYAVTLAKLSVAGQDIKEADLVPAMETVSLPLPRAGGAGRGAAVVYNAITDFGGTTDKFNASIQ